MHSNNDNAIVQNAVNEFGEPIGHIQQITLSKFRTICTLESRTRMCNAFFFISMKFHLIESTFWPHTKIKPNYKMSIEIAQPILFWKHDIQHRNIKSIQGFLLAIKFYFLYFIFFLVMSPIGRLVEFCVFFFFFVFCCVV